MSVTVVYRSAADLNRAEYWYEEGPKLQIEVEKLRKVADIAWNVVETKGLSDVLLSELAGRLADWETGKEGEI
jgi:hypothetical protein